MLNEPTLEKLKSLRLDGMAAAWSEQQQEPRRSLSLVLRRAPRPARRRRVAAPREQAPRALAQGGQAAPRPGLHRGHRLPAAASSTRPSIRQLATCRWVHEHQNVIITGATGIGKTYVACALAQQACRKGYRALYRRASRLFDELALARADGTYARLLARLARVDVLVLDDLGLAPIRDRAPRPARGPRGSLRHALDHHHQPAPADEVARLPRRPHPRRRHLRPAPPQRPPHRAKGTVAAKGEDTAAN